MMRHDDQPPRANASFKRLGVLRAGPDSAELAEALEVCYLCLLLGCEKRYGAGSKAELHQLSLLLFVVFEIDVVLGATFVFESNQLGPLVLANAAAIRVVVSRKVYTRISAQAHPTLRT
jgi:hypothetical protein